MHERIRGFEYKRASISEIDELVLVSRKMAELQPWEYLMKRIVWKQLGDIKGKKILDFGSGIGVTANYLAEHNDVTAIEPDENSVMMRWADNQYEQIIGSTEELQKFADETFDMIICHNVLEYVGDRAAIVKEFERILKAGGKISIEMFVTERQAESDEDKTEACTKDNVTMLHKIIRKEFDKVSDRELENLNGFIRKNKDEEYEITFGIYSKKHNENGLIAGMPGAVYKKEIEPLRDELLKLAEEYMVYCEELVRKEIPKKLMSQFNFCLQMIPFLRGMLVEGLLDLGYLKSEEELSDMIGVYTVVD